MSYETSTEYDFSVSDVGYVIQRAPNPTWKINGLKNDEYFLLSHALNGEAHYSWSGHSYTVKKGDVLFLPKSFVHSGASKPSNPWRFVYVAFDIHFFDPRDSQVVHKIQKLTTTLNAHQVSALFTELMHVWSSKLPGHIIRCRSLVMELLFLVIKETHRLAIASKVPHFYVVNNMAKMIQRDYELTFTLEELAARANLSPAYFRRLFKRVTGYTPSQYQNRVKVDKAKDLLLSGECNVSEAAASVGVENVFYFSRLFKQIASVNPSEFIRR